MGNFTFPFSRYRHLLGCSLKLVTSGTKLLTLQLNNGRVYEFETVGQVHLRGKASVFASKRNSSQAKSDFETHEVFSGLNVASKKT